MAAGPRGATAVDATRALRAAVHGYAQLQQAGGFGPPVDVAGSFDAMLDALVTGLVAPPDRLPALGPPTAP